MSLANEILRLLLEDDDSFGSEDFDIKDVNTPQKPVKLLPLGSVSHGTMREEDLIHDFLYLLRSVDPQKAAELAHEHAEDLETADSDEEREEINTDFCWETLVNALEEHTPPYTYFGAHPGDGSDYGVWVSAESIDDDLNYENTEELQSMTRDGPTPTGSKYIVVTDASGEYTHLLDGATLKIIWAI